ncbi:MAG: hypothetical protein AAF802_30330, partial [Planctomycetota bacterium]
VGYGLVFMVVIFNSVKGLNGVGINTDFGCFVCIAANAFHFSFLSNRRFLVKKCADPSVNSEILLLHFWFEFYKIQQQFKLI